MLSLRAMASSPEPLPPSSFSQHSEPGHALLPPAPLPLMDELRLGKERGCSLWTWS